MLRGCRQDRCLFKTKQGRGARACTWHNPRPRLTLTIWARRYIWAWLAVRAGEAALPRSTACWVMPEAAAAAEFTL